MEALESRLLLSAPDLVVTAVSVPTETATGQTITVSWTVKNIGDAPATADNWTDTLRLSPTSNFEDGGYPIAEQAHYVMNIAPGESYTGTAEAVIRKPGNLYVVVRIDTRGQQVEESDETNNDGGAPILVRGPDMLPTAVLAPATARLGTTEGVTIQWQGRNDGPGSILSSFYDRLWLSRDPLLSSDDLSWGSHLVSVAAPLAPGASYDELARVGIRSEVEPGEWFILVEANVPYQDSSGHDEDLSNQVMARPIRLLGPDLTVTEATAPAEAGASSQFQVRYSVANQGEADASGWVDRFFTSPDAVLDDSDQELAKSDDPKPQWDPNPPRGLRPGESGTWVSTVTMPAGVGGQFLLIKVGGNDWWGESDEENNVLAIPMRQLPPPDWIVSAADVPSMIVAGVGFAYSFTVTNTGQGPAILGLDAIYFSTDDVLDAGDRWLDYLHRERRRTTDQTTPPGGSYTHKGNAYVQYPVPWGPQYPVPSGPGYIIFLADYEDRQDEADEANNTLAVPLTVNTFDLALTSIQAPPSARAGELIDLTMTITNLGDGSAPIPPEGIRMELWLSTHDHESGFSHDNDSYIGLVHIDRRLPRRYGPWERAQLARRTRPIGPGESYTVHVRVRLPGGRAGQVHLGADLFGRPDADHTNQLASVPITVTAPDLVVTTIAVEVAPSGRSAEVTYSVENQGDAPAVGRWKDTVLFAHPDADSIDEIFRLSGVHKRRALAAGQSYTRTVRVKLPTPARLEQGPYAFAVVTDIRNRVAESQDLLNNGKETDPITFEPDVEPAPPVGSRVFTAGGRGSLPVMIRNRGLLPIKEVDVELYVSLDEILDDGDALLGRITGRRLSAGARRSIQVPFAIPPTLAAGRYHLIARTVSPADPNPTNNTAASLSPIEIRLV